MSKEIVWHSIDNLHCYTSRPQDRAKILAKVKFITGPGANDYEYSLVLACYDEKDDEIWNTEVDYGGVISFKQVIGWIYINELLDEM